jgi:hypothetical protein
MRVVFATAELSPVATVGGLAAAAAGLGAELRRLGVDLDLVMPDYGDVALADETVTTLDVPAWVGSSDGPGGTSSRRGAAASGVGAGHGAAPSVPAGGRRRLARQQRAVLPVRPRPRRLRRAGSARCAAPQRLAHRSGARCTHRPAADGRLDPQPRLSGCQRRIVAQPDRTASGTLRVVGRHQSAVGGLGVGRPDRGRVAALRHRDRHSPKGASVWTSRCATVPTT